MIRTGGRYRPNNKQTEMKYVSYGVVNKDHDHSRTKFGCNQEVGGWIDKMPVCVSACKCVYYHCTHAQSSGIHS